MKKISVITINFNNKKGLEKTMHSVLSQNVIHDFFTLGKDSPIEYILIDGGSTDGSAELISSTYKKLELSSKGNNPITYWVSERDKGIYNAMNKGLKKADGEYTLFLNSGDYLVTANVLEKVIEQMESGADYYCGDIQYDDTKHHIMQSPEKLTALHLFNSFIPHQATFIRTDLLKRRPYREDLKIVADWDQMVYELIYNNVTYQRINFVVSVFDSTGISSDNDKSLQLEERKLALKGIFSERMYDYIVAAQSRINMPDSFDVEIGAFKYDLKLIRKSFARLMKNLSLRYHFLNLFFK